MPTLRSVAEIRRLVMTNDKWTQRALVVLHDRQTAAEQTTQSTHVTNGKGFAQNDAFYLSSLAEQVKRGRTLSTKQLHFARYHRNGSERISKYAQQLFTIQLETQGVDAKVPVAVLLRKSVVKQASVTSGPDFSDPDYPAKRDAAFGLKIAAELAKRAAAAQAS